MKKYQEGDKGKAAKARAQQKYKETEAGQESVKKAQEKYINTEAGKRTQEKYVKTEAGQESLKKSQKKYDTSNVKRKFRRKVLQKAQRNSVHAKLIGRQRKMRRRLQERREKAERKFNKSATFINFAEGPLTATKVLKDHVEKCDTCDNKRDILRRQRKWCAPPFPCRGSGPSYRLKVAVKLEEMFREEEISLDSLATCVVNKKMLKNPQRPPTWTAALALANRVYLLRKSCIGRLTHCALALKDKAVEIKSLMSLVSKEEEDEILGDDEKLALLGLNCHRRYSEPYFPDVSYKSGEKYNFYADNESGVKNDQGKVKKEAKEKDSAVKHYNCTAECIKFTPDEVEQFMLLLATCAESPREKSADWMRQFIIKHTSCTFEETENGHNIYEMPCEKRNHPKECYVKGSGCVATEMLIRKGMVHYENVRKVHNILVDAARSHKILADLDAATVVGDLEYLAKLVRVQLSKAPSTSANNVSNLEDITAQVIEGKLAQPTVENENVTYRERFDKIRSNVPKYPCCSCDCLITPSCIRTIELSKWKQAKLQSIAENHPYSRLKRFLAKHGLLDKYSSVIGDIGGLEEEIIAEYSENLADERDDTTIGDVTRLAVDSEEDDDQEEEDEFELTDVVEKLEGLAICSFCKGKMDKGKIPDISQLNGMYIGEAPPELRSMNWLETLFIKQVKCFQTIIKKGPVSNKMPASDRLQAVKGRFIHLKMNRKETLKQLNKNVTDACFQNDDFVLVYGSKGKKENTVGWKNLVDRSKVYHALKWLKKNNRFYQDVEIPSCPEDILPDVFDNDIIEDCNEKQDVTVDDKMENVDNCESSDDEDSLCNDSDSDGSSSSDDEDIGAGIDRESDGNIGVTGAMGQKKYESTKNNDESGNGERGSDETTDKSQHAGSSSDDEGHSESWIREITKDEVDTKYAHMRMVGTENDLEASEIFEKIRVDSSIVPGHEINLDCKANPEVFPFGLGGKHSEREIPVQHARFEKSRLKSANNFVRRQIPYHMENAQQKETRQLQSGCFRALHRGSNKMTKKNFQGGMLNKDSNIMNQITALMSKIPSHGAFWRAVRQKVEEMISKYGPPTFWLTLSPGEFNDEEILNYLKEMNSDLKNLDKMTVSEIIAKDPVLATQYLQAQFDATFDFILNGQPLGEVEHQFGRTEYQSRLTEHRHYLFWIKGAPVMGVSTPEEILEFISKRVCCSMPTDPHMREIVKKFQMHSCNKYCLRGKKNRRKVCKFGFPRSVRSKPILHDLISSIASRQSGSYKTRLYELQRSSEEMRINDYNPQILYLWRGNMDIQYICENTCALAYYISKYQTKAPKCNFDDFNATELVGKSEHSKLLSLGVRLLKEREMGITEATNYLLGITPYTCSEKFQFVNCRFPEKRKATIKHGKFLESVADDSEDIFFGNLLSAWYPNRPDRLEDMTLYGFASKYERVQKSIAERRRDKSRVIELKNERGFMLRVDSTKKYPHDKIVIGPNLDPKMQSEEFYYSHIAMHVPWRDESEFMKQHAPYGEGYKNLSERYPALRDAVELSLRRNKIKADTKAKVRKEMDKEKDKDDQSNPSEKKVDEEANVDNETVDAESGDSAFENVRGNTAIKTEEQLRAVVENMSKDQRTAYDFITDNALHLSRHRSNPQRCNCEVFEPLNKFIYGGPGAGKSYLIKALMGFAYVESEVKKNPIHFLLAAPTGIAACNIGGQTLHSLWKLPVENKRKVTPYIPVSDEEKCRMHATFRHVCGMIIDEISMVNNKMLMYLNLRMMEIFLKDAIFGGIPMLVFGDMLQLEPVKEEPPYVALKPHIVARIKGGAPTSLDLWGSFGFHMLSTNHRSSGEKNTLWRSILKRVSLGMLSENDITVLNTRLIDTRGCITKEEKLNVFVKTFIEAEKEGKEPLCLFPKRSMCSDFNKAIMVEKGENPLVIMSQDTYVHPGIIKKNEIQRKVNKMDNDDRETAGLSKCLLLAVGSRVMNLVNSKDTQGLVNGARGTILKFQYESNRKVVSHIEVKFDSIDEPVNVKRIDKMFTPMSECYVHRKQFPVCLASSVTIHKSQSLSLPCVFADLGDEVFCDGQSHVALSRCMSLEGLYLLNFSPSKVKASKRACFNQARMEENRDMQFNRGKEERGKERVWYTKESIKKAMKITKEHLSEEKEKANNRKTAGTNKSKQPKRKLGKEKAASEQPSRKRRKLSGEGAARDRVIIDLDDYSVNSGLGALVPVEYFTYAPVDEYWQQRICNVYNLQYHTKSAENVDSPMHVSVGRRPRVIKMGGDGNCFYRSVAHIISGNEEEYPRVKQLILNFIKREGNRRALIRHVASDPHYLHTSGDGSFVHVSPADKVNRYIAKHKRRNEWADTNIVYMTAHMLKTPIWIFNDQGGVHRWHKQDEWDTLSRSRLCYDVELEETRDQSLFIHHPSGHFNAACNGFVPTIEE